MKKSLIIGLILIVSTAYSAQRSANQPQRQVRECYKKHPNALAQASRCADMAMARNISKLRKELKEAGVLDGRVTAPEYIEIYTCEGPDPYLIRKIINASSGKIVKTFNLQQFTTGTNEQERKDCQAAAFKQNFIFPNNVRVVCSCEGADPSLYLSFLDSDYGSIAEGKKYAITFFTIGDNDNEMKNCKSQVRKLSFCTNTEL